MMRFLRDHYDAHEPNFQDPPPERVVVIVPTDEEGDAAEWAIATT
jgi:hypothetical protein